MVPILHAYDRQVPDRTVMAFVPNEELRQVTFAAEHIKKNSSATEMSWWSSGSAGDLYL